MLAAERKRCIQQIVLEKKSATVNELAEQFDVTHETIRRDLKALESDGVLVRTYGGAFVQSGVESLVTAEVRKNAYRTEKELIASRCHKLVSNGDAIFLDNSTTSYYIAKRIADMELTVVTNNLMVINLLAKSPSVRLVSVGGEFSITEQSFSGIIALKTLREYYVDKAFISCRSLSIENGITESTDDWALIRQLMIERSDLHYLIADHTKFDKTSFVRISNIDAVTAIITDGRLSDKWHDAVADTSCRIIDSNETLDRYLRSAIL